MLVLKGNIPRFPWESSTTMLTYRLRALQGIRCLTGTDITIVTPPHRLHKPRRPNLSHLRSPRRAPRRSTLLTRHFIVETNGIEPSTSCLQSTLSIVRRVLRSVDTCSLIVDRSSCFRWSAGAQTSSLRTFICTRIDQYSLIRRQTWCRRWLRSRLRRKAPLTSCPPAHARSFAGCRRQGRTAF